MKFRRIAVPPAGRNKYGNYMSSTNVAQAVVRSAYYGDSTTNGNGGNTGTPVTPTQPEDSFLMLLSKTFNSFDGMHIAVEDVTETIDLIGYKNLTRCDTYVGDITGETDAGSIPTGKYDIIGLPEKGMKVTVTDNGTPDTRIQITVSSDISSLNGTLKIPCNVYRRSVNGDPLGDDISAWESHREDCSTLWLEWGWAVTTNSTSTTTEAYTLELTNELAGINCDSNGNILSGAIRPTCEADLYYGTAPVTGATYAISYSNSQSVLGLSIDTSTGVLTFGTNFSFAGTSLDVVVSASYEGNVVGRKVMTIVKQYPGPDGQPATTRWLTTSTSVIYVDINQSPARVVPSAVSAKVMKQVGESAPVEDTGTTIYYGYDTENPISRYTGNIPVDASKSYISFALKNSKGEIYEMETIPLIEAGKNGEDGQDGQDGQSAYRLDLSNDNASINCDSDGNVLAGAYRPKCTARLFLGSKPVEGATYGIVSMSEQTDITIDSTTGVMTVGDISFSNTALEVNVVGKINGVIYGQSVFSITKSLAGTPGNDGTSISIAGTLDSTDDLPVPPASPNDCYIIGIDIYVWDGANWKNAGQFKGADGADGKDGADGISIIWLGNFSTEPSSPKNGNAYYNTVSKKAYVYQDGVWYVMAMDGLDGQNGADGVNGEDGTSITWKGSYSSHPLNPENGWSYYNTTQKKSFVYQDGAWYQMTVDGVDGQNGENGISIVWKGDLASPPGNPKENWCYRDTDNGMVYIYTGTAWELMVVDGSDGADGTDGKDGLSVFITYHENPVTVEPSRPTGNGTTNGWHTEATATANWMSQKVAGSATDGVWGDPIQICGADGKDGHDGVNGADGVNGKDGTSIIWKGSSITHPANPENGWAYYNTGQRKSFIYQDGAWYQMTVDGVNGTNGEDGLSIVWKGDLSTPPNSPKENWCYRDTDNGKVYIYNGTAWELMVVDGSDGADGTDGADGLSVFITYHDSPISSPPSSPTGDGTSNGWHTDATSGANWMSQKVAESATDGAWGVPIQICGEDGKDAVSYWMEFSATSFAVDQNNVASPDSLAIQVLKQVGENTPVDVTPTVVNGDIQVKFGYDTLVPGISYVKNFGLSVNPTKNYLTVQLYVNGTKWETETLPILHDGKDGSEGSQGRQGAAVRGPVDWRDQVNSRRWCNGVLTNASYPEDGEFIDIVVYDGKYYRCTTSYTGAGRDSQPPVAYWKQTDAEYRFVATDLLLAENAKINFQTSNELYLVNSEGEVTAGAAGGDGINFWAGANEPSNGAFKVYNNGVMEATKGRFGIFSIGENDTYADKGSIQSSLSYDGDDSTITNSLQIDEMGLLFTSSSSDDPDNPIKAHINVDNMDYSQNHGDMYGIFSVEGTGNNSLCYYASGKMEASNYGFHNGSWVAQQFAPRAMKGLEICFVTDSSARFSTTTVNGTTYWTFMGNIIDDSLTKGANWTTLVEYQGEWCVRYQANAGTYFRTGIYTSNHSKQNNRIYIEI